MNVQNIESSSQIGDGDGQLAATAIGTLIGAGLGSEIGASLDKADRLAAAQAAQQALEHTPSDIPVAWNNPDSGHSGTVTAQPAVEEQGTVCRDYVHEVLVGGEFHADSGRACRGPDGTWETVGS